MEAAASWEPVETLKPWKENPRLNAGSVEPVARSMLRFGFGNPILARSEDREVIAGHTRLLAFAFLAAHAFDPRTDSFRPRRRDGSAFVLRGSPGPGLVPVRFLDVSAEEAHALALADNRLGELADWDPASLSRELAALRSSDVDLDGLGWSATDLAGLLGEVAAPPGGGAEDQPEVAPLPGAARLLLGRCEEQLRALDADSLDSCVCDPPYGLSDPPDPVEVLRCWLDGRPYVHPRPGFMGHGWDAFVPGPEVWREVYRVLKPGAYVVAFAGSRTVDWMSLSLRLAGFEIRDTGAWAPGFEGRFQRRAPSLPGLRPLGRRAGPRDRPRRGRRTSRQQRAPRRVDGLGAGRQDEPSGRWPSNVVQCSKAGTPEREAGCEALPLQLSGLRNAHPTLKPIRLMAWLARLVTPQGFGYVGCEIDPVHVRVAEARIGYWSRVGLGDLVPADAEEGETP